MASVITNISIKNIKGYGDPATSITLELKTNRAILFMLPMGQESPLLWQPSGLLIEIHYLH